MWYLSIIYVPHALCQYKYSISLLSKIVCLDGAHIIFIPHPHQISTNYESASLPEQQREMINFTWVLFLCAWYFAGSEMKGRKHQRCGFLLWRLGKVLGHYFWYMLYRLICDSYRSALKATLPQCCCISKCLPTRSPDNQSASSPELVAPAGDDSLDY
jgi:hypothetical protein